VATFSTASTASTKSRSQSPLPWNGSGELRQNSTGKIELTNTRRRKIMKSKTVEQYAADAYQSFCEFQMSGEMQAAWDSYQRNHGEILVGSDVEKLVFAAMKYAINDYLIQKSNEAYDATSPLSHGQSD
jgi:hypothetical protein